MTHETVVMVVLLSAVFTMTGCSQKTSSNIEQKVQELLAKMTLEEKVGQMTQVTLQVVSKTRGTPEQKHEVDPEKLREAIVKYHVGSILNVYDLALTLDEWQTLITQIQDIATKETRLGIPVIYGIDAIHGANYVREATLFPQSIAMAATRNPELVRKSAEITAYEIRAAGIPWNFNPVLGVGRNQLWPRLWETFGEDPYLVSVMGEAYIKGIEGDANNIGSADKAAACMKHYLGYTVPLSGKDRTPAWIPERMLRDYFLPPFKKAVQAGVHTVMVNSGEINGIPVHSDRYLLTDVLKDELGFRGVVVSDWEDIKRLYTRDKVAETPEEAVKMAVMAGIDMSMVPYDYSFFEILLKLVKGGEVPESRIDDAVSRILRVKFALNLFEKPYPNRKMKKNVGSRASAQISLQAAREALTLLKNENGFLPLKKNMKVLVAGPNAHMRSVLNGGWTYTWQGNEESVYPKNKKTILEAVQAKIGEENVIYVEGSGHEKEVNIKFAADAAKTADVAVVCIGEAPYCETPGNIHDLTLPKVQSDLVAAIQETDTPVVLVLVEGRPRVITPIVDDTEAILMAYLPGPEGGNAIADVLFGDFNPCGKLPFTYPRHSNDLVCYDHKPLEMDDPNKLNPLWEFGHGLSYTTFAYSDLKLDRQNMSPDTSLNVSVNVENTGDRAGKAVVELYVSDLIRSVSPPIKQLKRFTGVQLKPGESTTVLFTLDKADLSFNNRENKFVAEPGEFKITIGDLSDTFILAAEE
ncbi:MAG: glycoside hydrolase family 3 N-terminal domain-containing protein [bacterium]